MSDIQNLLSELYHTIKKESFAGGRGRGSQEPYYVFDYDPACELEVRHYIQNTLMTKLPKRTEDGEVIPESLNIFQVVIEELRSEGFYDGALDLQLEDGDEELIEALAGIVNSEYLAERIANKLEDSASNLLLLHGVGSAYPLICVHSLLSSLQSHLKKITVVLFFPGEYNEHSFKLLNQFEESPHYHSHRLLA
ncbi:DUF1788 domain-containing protein [Endozoicomonas gorgoniicola]|uniref:DUF1788 domain-containing protein n=1 Tax=Endozoicomonas gorgoniicola TaxID=1234144 RepID=A0ABT3MTZ4_9GAMM|nr:DUF1788 domain-containing protein [Endozoicomonas gorgoniicola]MCW7552864.1 DUF1788 domain-containing protein [Endozoicomonas gorgoniicola]